MDVDALTIGYRGLGVSVAAVISPGKEGVTVIPDTT
jgi:hypothetical protein